jgi:hypothetical protein
METVTAKVCAIELFWFFNFMVWLTSSSLFQVLNMSTRFTPILFVYQDPDKWTGDAQRKTLDIDNRRSNETLV